jgi:outer membrane protein OmpA-like peptidoglycan-associated protein
LPDGVEHWTVVRNTDGKPPFFALFEEIAKALVPSTADLPFNRSVAFLVGISDYKYIDPDLPFVKNDLEDMRDYLLKQGGFDEVYMVANSAVSSELIESYMMNKFRTELGRRDRLLFYYAGHGADASGITGYLQFSGAKPGNFAREVLPVTRILEWGRVNPAAHMLFILDTCSSGLAFSSRSGASEEDEQKLISTLSGGGSRTVITAGTAGEKTFEIKTSNMRGNGVFTRAFLDALGVGRAQNNSPAFLTVDQVFADLKISVAKFSAINRKPLNPNLWTFDDDEYRGSFLFLNPAARMSQIPSNQLAGIKARAADVSARPRGSAPVDPPDDVELIFHIPEEFSDSLATGECKILVSIQPEDASVYIDGRFLDVGREVTRDGIAIKDKDVHRLAVIRPGYKPIERTVTWEVCDRRRFSLVQEKTYSQEIEIKFLLGGARLSNANKLALDGVAADMKNNPDLHAKVAEDIEISVEAQRMQAQRAEAVKHYLVTRHGINPSRITAGGRAGADLYTDIYTVGIIIKE